MTDPYTDLKYVNLEHDHKFHILTYKKNAFPSLKLAAFIAIEHDEDDKRSVGLPVTLDELEQIKIAVDDAYFEAVRVDENEDI